MHTCCIYRTYLSAFLIISQLENSHAHRNGVPMESCNTLMPLHGARPSQLPQPFILRLYDQIGNPVYEYKPGDKRALRREFFKNLFDKIMKTNIGKINTRQASGGKIVYKNPFSLLFYQWRSQGGRGE